MSFGKDGTWAKDKLHSMNKLESDEVTLDETVFNVLRSLIDIIIGFVPSFPLGSLCGNCGTIVSFMMSHIEII